MPTQFGRPLVEFGVYALVIDDSPRQYLPDILSLAKEKDCGTGGYELIAFFDDKAPFIEKFEVGQLFVSSGIFLVKDTAIPGDRGVIEEMLGIQVLDQISVI